MLNYLPKSVPLGASPYQHCARRYKLYISRDFNELTPHRHCQDRSWLPAQRRHPPDRPALSPALPTTASICTSRTNRPTRPAASSTGWPGRCFYTACATRARPWLSPAAAPRRSAKPTLRGWLACPSLP